jgi:hypothetical protein
VSYAKRRKAEKAILDSLPPDPYPEHTKLSSIKDKSQACGEFIDWLESKGIFLAEKHSHVQGCYAEDDHDREESPGCGFREGELLLSHKGIFQLLSGYFGIDLQKLDDEKRAMLEQLRAEQRGVTK